MIEMELVGERVVQATTTSTRMVDLLVIDDINILPGEHFQINAEMRSLNHNPDFPLDRARDEVIEACLKLNGQPLFSIAGDRTNFMCCELMALGEKVTSVILAGRTKDPWVTVQAKVWRGFGSK